MTRLVLRLLVLSLAVLWTALPSGQAHAAGMGAACCDPPAAMQMQAAPAVPMHHGMVCMSHCLPADRLPDASPAGAGGRVSRFAPRPADLSLVSRAIAPSTPPPRI
ncbi:hypothetical protein [Mangrovicoccus sp. HB161399]|uniref:hypothetical protein n=1 Tax=Mangrovicoccus sp. HB161399 TaxID=2720392 RepID=UPI0015551C02|nr:hypothetical protein [Mangrovicoccus sp. HB161399]